MIRSEKNNFYSRVCQRIFSEAYNLDSIALALKDANISSDNLEILKKCPGLEERIIKAKTQCDIKVKRLTGESFTLTVSRKNLVNELFNGIAEKLKLDSSRIRLILPSLGRELDRTDSIEICEKAIKKCQNVVLCILKPLSLQFEVKFLDGKHCNLSVSSTGTVADLLSEISKFLDIPPSQFLVIDNGRRLDLEADLTEVSKILHCVLKPSSLKFKASFLNGTHCNISLPPSATAVDLFAAISKFSGIPPSQLYVVDSGRRLDLDADLSQVNQDLHVVLKSTKT